LAILTHYPINNMAFFAIAGAVSTVVGTVMSVQGQRAAAQAQQQQAQYQIDLANQTAKWNADQTRQQAKHEEDTAMENMRRKRENNQRAIARQRAVGARSGLKETGAVADVLVDTSERLQSDIDDIWKSASERATQLRGDAQMSLWENDSRTSQLRYGASAAKQASKYSIYGTIAGGLGKTATAGFKVKNAWKTR
jgi:hypothetical protein